jgi:hypothetical protein
MQSKITDRQNRRGGGNKSRAGMLLSTCADDELMRNKNDGHFATRHIMHVGGCVISEHE